MKKTKRLTLSRETLRNLQSHLNLVAGGILPDNTDPTYPSYWCTQGFTSCTCPTALPCG